MSRANPSFDAQRRLIQDAVNEADFYVDFSPYQLIYVVSPAGQRHRLLARLHAQQPVLRRQGRRQQLHARRDARQRLLRQRLLRRERADPRDRAHVRPARPLRLRPHRLPVQHLRRRLGHDGQPRRRRRVRRLAAAAARLDRSGAGLCVASADSRDVRLSPMEKAGGTKAAIVQTGPNDFSVAENRQATAEDALLCDAGMLVYTVGAGDRERPRLDPRAARRSDNGTKSVTRCGPLYNAAFDGATRRTSSGSVADDVQCKARRATWSCASPTASRSSRRRARCACRPPRRRDCRAGRRQARVGFTPPPRGRPVLWYTATAVAGRPDRERRRQPDLGRRPRERDELHVHGHGLERSGAGPASAESAPVTPLGEARTAVEPPSEASRPDVPDFTPPSGARPPRPAAR